MIKVIYENVIRLVLERAIQKDELIRVFEVLNKYNYTAIGGFAVSFYSKGARKISPEDIDILIDKNQALHFKNDMEKLGFNLIENHYFDGDYWYVYEKDGQGVDVAVSGDKITNLIVDNPRIFKFNNFNVKVIDLKYLIYLKLKADRNKDKRDVTYLLKEMSKEDFIEVRNLIGRHLIDKLETLKQLRQDAKMFDTNFIDKMYN